MKISEYVQALEAIEAEHGDLEVETEAPWGRGGARHPEVAFRRILTGRKSRPSFWYPLDPSLSEKGEKVVRV